MLLLLASTLALAVEGMWEPSQLPGLAAPLRAAGYDGDPAALARLDAAPLAAIASIGGCTASFVSADGLLATNHHCVDRFLLGAQKEGENLVEAGFHAPTRAEERSGGAANRLQIVESFEDVTARVTGKIPTGTSDLARKQLIDDRVKALVAACEKAKPDRRCRVASYYQGMRQTLITSLELRDLRVVYVPPDAVGNYGDELDNWHWPRHAGDFAFLRAYVGPDGKPADYSPSNVPYHPAVHLRLAARGPEPGEFVMVAGYPGGTDRWRTGAELQAEAERRMPSALRSLQWTFDLLTEEAERDPAARGALMSRRGGVGNGLSNTRWTLQAFQRTGAVAAALERDRALRAWIAADPAREARWGAAVDELAKVLLRREGTRPRDEAYASFMATPQLEWARRLLRVAHERQLPEAKRELGYQERDLPRLRQRIDADQRRLHLPSERRYADHFLAELLALPADQRVPQLDAWLAGRSPAQVVEDLYRDSAVDTVAERLALFDAPPTTFATSKDPLLSLVVALWPYDEARRQEEREDAGALARLRPLHAEALRQFDPAHAYPDANGTLRVTFGTVQGYAPRDGVVYGAQTTLAGVLEKAGNWPYAAPPALLDAIRAGKKGPYLDPALGDVPVDFASDLDITGGNSGSPTLNSRGELVGLAFDGNVEGIASDWVFDPKLARTVHVDVRYILYYLDAVAGADELLAELGVKPAF